MPDKLPVDINDTVRQDQIVIARNYNDGNHNVKLTERLKQFLNQDFPFRLNMCRTVVSAVAERLRVIGFDSVNTNLIDWATNLWDINSMAAIQEEIYEAALRDGEGFMIVDWDNELLRPRWVFNERYTSKAAGGNDTGCWMVYEQNDHRQKPLYAVKQWSEIEEGGDEYQIRRTYYYPDRVEKYVNTGNEWKTFEATIPWMGPDKLPLGIAAIPFNNKGLRCEAWDAFPLQDALNKTLVDLLSSSDITAFRIFYALGFIPTTDGKTPAADGSNLLKIEPGTVVGTSKSARDAEFGAIEPANIAPLMDEAHQIVLWCAMVTATPVSRFISTRLVASESTLKEQEGPLISRVTARQESFKGSWSKCLTLSAKLQTLYGEGAVDIVTKVTPTWADAASRGEAEKMDVLQQKKALGVPTKQLWIEMGYDNKTIEKMEQMQQEARDEQQRIFGSGDGTDDNSGDGTDDTTADGGAATSGESVTGEETE